MPHDKGWQVIGQDNKQATSVHQTQREAIEAACEIARKQKGEVHIYGTDGEPRKRIKY